MGEDAESQDKINTFNRAYGLYWIELVQLKVDTVYVERYRDWLTAWLSRFAIGRAIVSVGALSSWFAGIGHPEVWGGIIVASQVAEAVVNALPLSARQKNLSAFALALEAILIDALMEWEDIHFGEIGARDITRRRHALMRLRHETEAKHLPSGLPVKRKFSMLAEREASAYFESIYGVKPRQEP
jgi:hypothetical protein